MSDPAAEQQPAATTNDVAATEQQQQQPAAAEPQPEATVATNESQPQAEPAATSGGGAPGEPQKADAPAKAEGQGSEAAPASSEPAPAAAATAVDPELQAKIDELKKSNAEKKEQWNKLQQEAKAGATTTEDVKQAIQSLNQKIIDLGVERDALKKRQADLLPAYERCLQNKDVKEKAIQSRQSIEELEHQLAADHQEQILLLQELDRISKVYEESISRKNKFFDALRKQVTDLKEIVDQKLTVTVHDENVKTPELVAHLLDVTGDLVEQRERDVISCHRHQRELQAGNALKSDMLTTQKADNEAALESKKKMKDEYIKETVYSMQEERNVLQADIDEVRRVNEEQATNLARGHVMVTKPLPKKGSSSSALTTTRAASQGRVTKFAEPAAVGEGERMLIERNAAVEREIQQTNSQLALETKNKTELAKMLKTLQDKVKHDKEAFHLSVLDMEAKVVSQIAATKLLEKDNSRIVDQVDHLTITLKTTKSHIERIRGKAAPLPIEE